MSATNPGRVAIVGNGSRGIMFVNGIAERPNSVVVALCDHNPVRSEYYNQVLEGQGRPKAPIYKPEQFGEMLVSEKVDTVVITTVDATHHLYIIPALEAGGGCYFVDRVH
jgi:predicted dehydrogenase